MNRSLTTAQKRQRRDAILLRLGVITAFILAAAIIILLITTFTGSSSGVSAKAAASSNHFTRYESVQIERGDSLWSIATKYCPDYSNNTAETVEMLISLNSLKSETIHTGGYILVPVEVELEV